MMSMPRPCYSTRRGVVWLILVNVVATVSAQHAVIFQETGPGSSCHCVLLSECPSLLPPPGQRLTHQQAAKIQSHKCGFEGRSLKVCCPDQGGSSPPTTEAAGTTPPLPSTAPSSLPLKCGESQVTDRIFGGTNAPLGSHPWMVGIGYRVPTLGAAGGRIQYLCGGSLVTAQHVVTAAHCVHPSEIGSASVSQLNVGEWNIATDPDCTTLSRHRTCAPPVVVRQPATITWHPRYNTNGKYNNDIAVIRLNQPVTFGAFIQPVCIPRSFDPSFPDGRSHALALATGWGATETGGSSSILQEVRLPFVDIATCNASYLGLLSGKQLCAGGERGQDSCTGDSGGPLITTAQFGPPYWLVGLTSFGRTVCGGLNNYGVYTSVPEFRDWIEENLSQ